MDRITKEVKGCLCGVNPRRIGEAFERLREYEDTDLSPDEIHIMSEELAAYHEMLLSPEEIKKLRKKIVTKPIEVYKGAYLCPECGWIVGFVGDEKGRGIQKHCERCGQVLVDDKGKYELMRKEARVL